MTCLLIAVLAFGSILLTSLTTPQSKPTLTRTSGGFGSNLSVYEYKASDGSIYVIVQGNGGTGPVAVHSK
jgi:hypothetical protein